MRSMKLPALALLIAAAGVTSVKAQTADEIIAKHNKAIGGVEKWNEIKSMKLVGSMSMQGMEIGMNSTVVTGKGMRMDISAAGMNGYMIATPKEGWTYMPMQGQTKPEPMPAEMLSSMQGRMDVKESQIIDKSKITKAELAGKDTVDNVACYKVKITEKNGTVNTDYFDMSTYYMLKMEVRAKGPDGQEQEMAYNYKNFQKQPEGIVYPMTVGTPQGDVVFKSIEINKPVDESIFKPDADKK